MISVQDDMLLLIYRHALINALKNPYMLLFDTDGWVSKLGIGLRSLDGLL